MPKLNTLQDIYINELRDLYNMETQLTKTLPRIAKAISHSELKQAFENHLEQTENHIDRLEQVFEMCGQKVRGKKCTGMEGILDEALEILSSDVNDDALDAAIIGAAQKVEHYEIASYGTVRTWAEQLGFDDQAELLNQTLSEEKQANEKLTQLAEQFVNEEASHGESEFEVAHNGYDSRSKSNGRSSRRSS